VRNHAERGECVAFGFFRDDEPQMLGRVIPGEEF
jgi:hypothetical protein